MKILSRFPQAAGCRHRMKRDVEGRFLELYSMWHETHDLHLKRRLYASLNRVMRRMPNFDLRRRFKQAF
ncbi:MAG: hypothetical protein HY584_06075 [Candidatus Omnitrophica bacterium]|nr:hypothetical protein [Candidatus Omnitrophota bacterium]